MANQEFQIHIPMAERLKSIPEIFGIRLNEEPSYEVLKKDGDFEIRRYSKQLRAKVSMQGSSFDDFREAAFKKLAAYIFGANQKNLEIAMTSPVLQENAKHLAPNAPALQQQYSSDEWTMTFVLPAQFNKENAPAPQDSDIHLEDVTPYVVASVEYSGNNSLEKIEEHEKKLADWLDKQPNFKGTGKFYSAQYDQPFAIPFLKRNEVQIKVTSMH